MISIIVVFVLLFSYVEPPSPLPKVIPEGCVCVCVWIILVHGWKVSLNLDHMEVHEAQS